MGSKLPSFLLETMHRQFASAALLSINAQEKCYHFTLQCKLTDVSYHVLACVAGGIVGACEIKFWWPSRYFRVPLPILLVCEKYTKPDLERFIKQGN